MPICHLGSYEYTHFSPTPLQLRFHAGLSVSRGSSPGACLIAAGPHRRYDITEAVVAAAGVVAAAFIMCFFFLCFFFAETVVV